MIPSEFTFKGVSSLNYNIRMQLRPVRTVSFRNIVEASPSNYDGTFRLDRGTSSNVDLVFDILYEIKNGGKTIDDVVEWLDDPSYQKLVVHYDPNYVYYATLKSATKFTTVGIDHNVMTAQLTWTVLPYKFVASTLIDQELGAGKIIQVTNTTKYNSRPKLILKPSADSGTMSLRIGPTTYKYQKVPLKGLTIDTNTSYASSPTSMVGLEFPYFPPGTTQLAVYGGTLTYTMGSVRRVV